MERFTVCYRAWDRRYRPALIVADEGGVAYLFAGAALQVRLDGPDAPARLRALLARRAPWNPVPIGAPYSRAELCRLVESA